MANISVEKPRLRFAYHVWSCVSWKRFPRSPRCPEMTAGYGYTPLEAFNDWKARL